MSVSVVFSRSVSSATTRSLSDLCTPSPPFAHAVKAAARYLARCASAGLLPFGRQLSRAGGCASLRRYRFGLFLQLFDDAPGPPRVDVDAGAHRARQLDAANV